MKLIEELKRLDKEATPETGFSQASLDSMDTCRHLLPQPAFDVVGQLISEIRRLNKINTDFSNNLPALIARLEAADKLRAAMQDIANLEGAPSIDVSGDLQFGLHCGVEDRDCTDRYEGADFGWSQGVERTLEWATLEAAHALAAFDAAGKEEV